MREETNEGLYLVIVRRNDDDTWTVDVDSHHILEDEGGYCPALELQVRTIRALAPTPEAKQTERLR